VKTLSQDGTSAAQQTIHPFRLILRTYTGTSISNCQEFTEGAARQQRVLNTLSANLTRNILSYYLALEEGT